MPGPHPRNLSALMLVALAMAVSGCAREPDAPKAPEHGTRLAGVLLDPQMDEISGLAASRRHRDVLWMHDDGGNPERLFAVSTNGTRLATLRVEGVTKTDWEDIAAFELDGKSLPADRRHRRQRRPAAHACNCTSSRNRRGSRTRACARPGRSPSAGPMARATARRWPSTRKAGRSC